MDITMAQAIRGIAFILLGFLAGACVRLGHIQQKEPVRTMNFTGSPKAVAQCIQQRLGGKVQEESFNNRFIIYDSAKGGQREYGITHYSVTISQISPKEGVAELRVTTPPADSTYANVPPGKEAAAGLPAITMEKFWTPVVRCAEQAKGAS